MRNKHRNLLSVALVLLCIALLAGTAVLLLRALPKKQPGTVETIQTGAVFDQTGNTAAPDREQAYDGDHDDAPFVFSGCACRYADKAGPCPQAWEVFPFETYGFRIVRVR